MKASVDTLAFEITRRCNMCCEHCMRGDAQNKDMTEEIIDATLVGIESIGSMVLTGGEPSLNVPAMRYIAKRIDELGIPLGSVYLVTNGKVVSNDFLLACLELFIQADEPDMNGLALSKDMFHEDIPWGNINKLSQLTAFTSEDKDTDFDKYPVINLGRAKSLDGFKKQDVCRETFSMDILGNVPCIESTITVTVDGDILSGCDYSYDEADNIQVGSVKSKDWVKALAQDYCAEDIETLKNWGRNDLVALYAGKVA